MAEGGRHCCLNKRVACGAHEQGGSLAEARVKQGSKPDADLGAIFPDRSIEGCRSPRAKVGLAVIDAGAAVGQSPSVSLDFLPQF